MPPERPRPSRECLEHGHTVDALRDQLGAVGANLLEPRDGISVPGHVAHDFRLFFHGAPVTRAAEDKAWAVLEDLGVSTRCHEGAGGMQHAITVSHTREPPAVGLLPRGSAVARLQRLMSKMAD